MNRRDALKGAGMAFSGLVMSTGDKGRDKEVLAKLDGVEEVRIIVEPRDQDALLPERGSDGLVEVSGAGHNIAVYELRTDRALPWLVQSMDIHLSLSQGPTVFLRFVKDEPVYGVRVSAYGFLMDYAFEGRVRA